MEETHQKRTLTTYSSNCLFLASSALFMPMPTVRFRLAPSG